MKPCSAVVLRFHTIEAEGRRVAITEAIDVATGAVVASYSLGMMRAWLKRHGYRWRVGSSGIWHKVAA